MTMLPVQNYHLKIGTALGLGLLGGILALIHPVLASGLLINAAFFLWLIKSPALCWKFLIMHSLVFTFLIPEKIGMLLGWQLLPAFIISMAWYAYTQTLHSVSRKLIISAVLFLSWALVTGLLSDNQVAAVKEVLRYVLSFGLFFIYLAALNEKQAMLMLRWWTYSIVAADVLLLTHFFIGISGHALPLYGDFAGQISNLSWSFSIFLIVYLNLLLHNWRIVNKSQILFLALTLFALYLTGGRTAYFSTILGFLILGFTRFSSKSRRILLISVITCGILGFLCLALFYENSWDGFIQNLSGRNLLWKAALKAITENPFTGIGPGNWQDWLSSNYVSADFLLTDRGGNSFALVPSQQPGEAHNLYLTKMAEMGIPSLFLILLFFATWFHFAKKSLSSLSLNVQHCLAFGSFVAMVSMTFYGLLENGPIIGRGRGPEAFLLWFIAALPFITAKWSSNSDENLFLPNFLKFRSGGIL